MTKLPSNWSSHVAPSGHFYYYNSVTKESTYEKPKLDTRAVPKFKYELQGTDWDIIFTDKGTHFYHNAITKESHWSVTDDHLLNEIVAGLDKSQLLLLIAKARGLKLDSEDIKETIDNQIDEEAHHLEEDTTLEKGNLVKEGSDNNGAGILGGYSSSDDDDDEDDDDEMEDQSEKKEHEQEAMDQGTEEKYDDKQDDNEVVETIEYSSDDENVFNPEDLSSDEEDSNPNKTLTFLELLSDSSLDPYGTWESESLKIINDPRFYEVATNKERKEIFDKWCDSEISTQKAEMTLQGDDNDKVQDLIEDEPIVKFFKFISSEDVELEDFFFEFKDEHEDELKQFNELMINDRDQEKLYKEYHQFVTKSDNEKEKIFESFLTSSKIFKKNLEDCDVNKVRTLYNDISNYDDIEECTKALKELERTIKLSESIKFNSKYWIIKPNEKLKLLREVIKLLLNINE